MMEANVGFLCRAQLVPFFQAAGLRKIKLKKSWWKEKGFGVQLVTDVCSACTFELVTHAVRGHRAAIPYGTPAAPTLCVHKEKRITKKHVIFPEAWDQNHVVDVHSS